MKFSELSPAAQQEAKQLMEEHTQRSKKLSEEWRQTHTQKGYDDRLMGLQRKLTDEYAERLRLVVEKDHAREGKTE